MFGPWRDPETGTVVQFCSSYRAESTYRLSYGVAGPEPRTVMLEARRDGTCASVTDDPPPVPVAWITRKTLPPEILAVWDRYVAAEVAKFDAWCREIGRAHV